MQMIRMTGFICPSKRWLLFCLLPLLFLAQNLKTIFQPSKVHSTQELSYTSMAPWPGQYSIPNNETAAKTQVKEEARKNETNSSTYKTTTEVVLKQIPAQKEKVAAKTQANEVARKNETNSTHETDSLRTQNLSEAGSSKKTEYVQQQHAEHKKQQHQKQKQQQQQLGPIAHNKSNIAPYAYVFMAWRVDPTKPTYWGYLANVLITAKLLREHGSKADIIAVYKLSYEYPFDKLPKFDEDLLASLGVEIRYLAKEDDRGWSMYATTFNKFYIFNMTEYRRVMFLDGDLLPIGNMDYLFELSDSGVFKENILIAGILEPANAGTMLIKPNATVYQTIERLREVKGKRISDKKLFDTEYGWGHKIEPPDLWETNNPLRNGTEWEFWGAFCEQGYIYYFCKYVAKSCTHILSRKIYNFGPGPNGTTAIEKMWKVGSLQDSPMAPLSKRHYSFLPRNCHKFAGAGRNNGYPGCVPPWSDFHHFVGSGKPWLSSFDALKSKEEPKSSDALWWHELLALEHEYGVNVTSFGFNITNLVGTEVVFKQIPAQQVKTVAKTQVKEVARRDETNSTHETDSLRTQNLSEAGSSKKTEYLQHQHPLQRQQQPQYQKQQHQKQQQQQQQLGPIAHNKSNIAPYAYVFMAWRVDPTKPTYWGYLANVLISAKLLREHGSKADIIAVYKLSYEYPFDKLPKFDEDLLVSLGVEIRYLAKEDDSGWSMYATTFNKFYIFNMTEYRRVMFLDGDLLPIGNMDYLFELSDSGVFKENILIAGILEPANAGTMLIKPNATVYQTIERLREEKGKGISDKKLFDTEYMGGGTKLSRPIYGRPTILNAMEPNGNSGGPSASKDTSTIFANMWLKVALISCLGKFTTLGPVPMVPPQLRRCGK
jgi:signal peptidase I